MLISNKGILIRELKRFFSNAMTYRQRGSDFWPGPLDQATGNTSKAQCDEWDRIYKVDGKNIIDHANNFTGVVNEQIEEWPGDYAPYYDGDAV